MSADERDALQRAQMDMLAYAVHPAYCIIGKVLAPTQRMTAAIREKRCSCGLNAAHDAIAAALADPAGAEPNT